MEATPEGLVAEFPQLGEMLPECVEEGLVSFGGLVGGLGKAKKICLISISLA